MYLFVMLVFQLFFLFERIVFIQAVKTFSVICGQFETWLLFYFFNFLPIKPEKKIKESHTVHHFKTHCMCESNLKKDVRGILQQGCFLHYEGRASKWGVSSWTTSVGLASSLVPTVTPSWPTELSSSPPASPEPLAGLSSSTRYISFSRDGQHWCYLVKIL